jgi:hypothetical protein
MAQTVEERLLALEDRFSIINLKADYWRWADGGWDRESHHAKNVAALFVEDGIFEVKGVLKAVGRAEIIELFDNFRERLPFMFHHGSSPTINVSGDTAQGEWHLIAMREKREQDERCTAEIYIVSYYNDEFVRTPDGWRFKHLLATPVVQPSSAVQRQNGFAKGDDRPKPFPFSLRSADGLLNSDSTWNKEAVQLFFEMRFARPGKTS